MQSMSLMKAENGEREVEMVRHEDGRFSVLVKSPEIVSSSSCAEGIDKARQAFANEMVWQSTRASRNSESPLKMAYNF